MVFNNLLQFEREAISPRLDTLPNKTVMIRVANDSLAMRTVFELPARSSSKEGRWLPETAENRPRCPKKNLSRGGWFGFWRRYNRRQFNQRGGSAGSQELGAVLAGGRFWRRKGSELGRAWGGTDGLGGELFLSAFHLNHPTLLSCQRFSEAGGTLVCLQICSRTFFQLRITDHFV